MHPAYSVILFTTASGAGYGMLALLGLVALAHGRASSTGFALTSCVVALCLITLGLLSSTFHLGHPERAWRALSQWRSSWLSREAVLALVTYPVALVFAALWSAVLDAPGLLALAALLTILCCAATVWCTGMIYASLKTIRQWHNRFTVPVYLVFALATGAPVLAAVAFLFERLQTVQALIAGLALVLAGALKRIYWSSIDREQRTRTMASATGLGAQVRQWETPHTAINFVQKEMGYAVARKHAHRLRVAVDLCLTAAALSIVMAFLSWQPFVLLSPVFALAAAGIERWLFFAEAEHISMLYYGAEAR